MANDRTLTKQRPYLLRAMHEWMTDNGLTPHIVVDATKPGLSAPSEHIEDGKLVLNLSYAATRNLTIDNDATRLEARFGGIAQRLTIPVDAIMGIYARETGQGMVFADGDTDGGDDSVRGTAETANPDESDGTTRPTLKIVK